MAERPAAAVTGYAAENSLGALVGYCRESSWATPESSFGMLTLIPSREGESARRAMQISFVLAVLLPVVL